MVGYRFPDLNVVTANELHVPASDPASPSPTLMMLFSALLAASTMSH